MRKRPLGVGPLAAALLAAALSWPSQPQAQAAGLRVQYRTGSAAASTSQIAPVLSVVNGGSATVALSGLTLRYWYTVDGAQTQTYRCDRAPSGCATVTARFAAAPTPTSTADSYLEIGFTAGAGSLAPGKSTGEIQGRFSKSRGNYTQSNDYSFDGTKKTLADWRRVTLYRNGALIWGTEPTGRTADTTPPSVPAGLASPSKTSTTVSLTWSPSTDDVGVAGYDVYRGTALIGSSTGTSYTVTGLTAATTYSFTVRARDAAGNASAAGTALTVTTSPATTTEGIRVSASSLDLGTVTAGTSRSKTFAVANTGTSALAVTLARSSSTSAEFTVSPPSFSLAAGGRKVAVVTYKPTAVGSDSGAVVVTSNDPAQPSINVALSAVCADTAYPGCKPTTAGHTTDTNCVSCHSSNPCSGGGLYPGCAAPKTTRHAGRTDCTTCHAANPCTSFPFPGCRMPGEDHSGTNANCAQCHRSNPCSDGGDD